MITADEARGMVNRASSMADIERAIDSDIRAACLIGNFPLTISVKGWPRAPLDHVLEKYTRHGWKCSIVYDQRDGDYIQFEAP